MGFDVTWHPISQEEMFLWYFDRLEEARRGDYATAMSFAKQYRMGKEAGYEDSCKQGYQGMLEQGAGIPPDAPFDKTHSFLLAMVQGMFRTYYYTRGGIYSGLAEMDPHMASYTLPFQDILGPKLQNPVRNRIYENYCGGVYIPEKEVPRLLEDYESGKVEGPLRQCFGNTLPVFLKALLHAKKERLGLLEATEVVEPNPMDLRSTNCRSYLMNCDMDGVMIYAETAKHQLEEAIRQSGGDPAKVQVSRQVSQVVLPPDPPEEAPKPPSPPKEAAPKKKGFFSRLFGGN